MPRLPFLRCVAHALIVVAAVASTSSVARAQWRVGGWAGGEHESSWDEFLVIGADARGAVRNGSLELNPRFAYFLRSDETRFQLDFNLIKPLVLAHKSSIEPFIGIGAAMEHFSFDGGLEGSESENNIGFNYLMGGTIRTSGRLSPFAQFEYTVLHDAPNAAVLSIGLHVSLGGNAAPKAPPARSPARR